MSKVAVRQSMALEGQTQTVEVYNKGLQEVKQDERKKARKIERIKRVKYQWFVFLQAFVKLYILSLCILTNVTYGNIQDPGDINDPKYLSVSLDNIEIRNYNRNLTLCMAMVITGNIMDNIGGQGKRVMVGLDLALGCTLMLWALGSWNFEESYKAYAKAGDANVVPWPQGATYTLMIIGYLNYIVAGAVLIILFVQVQNWYSKKAIAFVLAFFIWAQALGYMTWIHIDFANNWIKQLVCGCLMIGFGVFDHFYWFYTPTQANIFIGESTRSKEDKFKFEAFVAAAEKTKEANVNVVIKKEQQKDLKISLMAPFKYTDFILLLIAASFKTGASRMNYDLVSIAEDFNTTATEPLADYRVYSVQAQFDSGLVHSLLKTQDEFFIGFMVGTVLSACFFMFLFKKKIYLLIVFFNSIQIMFEVIWIFLNFIDTQINKMNPEFSLLGRIPEIFYIFGGLMDVTSLFLMVNVLPALLALKYKGTKFEVTMAGTLISLILAGSFVMGTIIEQAVLPFYLTQDGVNWETKRIVFCCLLLCSNIPYLEWAHLEYQDIWRMRTKVVRHQKRKGKHNKVMEWLAANVCICQCCQKCLGISDDEEVYADGIDYDTVDLPSFTGSVVGRQSALYSSTGHYQSSLIGNSALMRSG